MAAHYILYCRRSAASITPEQLLAGTRQANLHTIAENDGIPDDMIVDALKQLRIENVDPKAGRHGDATRFPGHDREHEPRLCAL
jgi:hypothetical protein